MTDKPPFDPDFAAPTEWARMYRAAGFQVVPAMTPSENHTQWKRPALPKWRALEHELAPDLTFERWYGEQGEHAHRNNMGIITGACSDGAFMVDLDLHKDPAAATWWAGLLALHNMGGDIETPRQTTGGGGKQILFRAPAGWTPPTCKTSIGVDIRGQGGFAMLPPSMHESGTTYKWDAGLEPWEAEIMEAPLWLCDEIDALVNQYGGHRAGGQSQTSSALASSPTVRTATPASSLNAFGLMIDGREDYATKLVWARVVDERRQCPIKPGPAEVDQMTEALFVIYERNVKSRLSDPAKSNEELLEREGRGKTMLHHKMRTAFAQWDGKVARDAAIVPAVSISDKDPFSTHVELDENILSSTTKKVGFKGIPANEIKPALSLRWLIKGVLPQKGLAIVYGAPGSGKSFFVIDLVAHISSPELVKWRNRKAETGGVAYCFLEGGFGAHNRISALSSRLGDLGSFFSYPYSMNLSSAPKAAHDGSGMTKNDAKILVGSIREQQGAVAVVVIDTLSRAMSGKDENSSTEMTAFIAAMDYIAAELECLVVVVHHSGKDQSRGARGHSSLLGAIETEIEITRPSKETTGRIAKMTKMKEGGDGDEFAFELEQFVLGDDEDGEPVSTCVVSHTELDPTKHKPKRQSLGPNEQIVLKAYETFQCDYPDMFTPNGIGFPERPTRCVELEPFRKFAEERMPDGATRSTRKVRDALRGLTEKSQTAINGGVVWRIY